MTSRLTSSASTPPSALVVTCPGLRLPSFNAYVRLPVAARIAEAKRTRGLVSRCAATALASVTRTTSS